MTRPAFRRLGSSIVVCAAALFAGPLFAYTTCRGLDACAAAGHQFTQGSWYPYSDDNTFDKSVTLAQSSGWVTLQSGCADNNRNNLMPGTPVAARLLGYLRIDGATVSPGAHYEVQFLIDGMPVGSYIRAFQGILPQADHFNAIMPYLPAGDHVFEIHARLDDPGTITFGHEFTTSIGAPFYLPAFSQRNGSSFIVNGTWQQASDTVIFTNATGGSIDLEPQAYFEMASGTFGDDIGFGFSLDGQSFLRTSEIGAPQYYTQGINIFDHIANVGPGTHTLSFWLIDRDGGTMRISGRQIEMISFPAATNNSRGDTPLLADGMATTPIEVNAASSDHPNFPGSGDTAGGGWTRILEYTMPATPGTFNYPGDAYVEILGTKNGAPATTADIAIELIAADGGDSDAPWVRLSVSAVRSQVYLFADSRGWSDAGETVRLWMRPRTDVGSTGSTFTVGRRYLGLKLVPVDYTTCYN